MKTEKAQQWVKCLPDYLLGFPEPIEQFGMLIRKPNSKHREFFPIVRVNPINEKVSFGEAHEDVGLRQVQVLKVYDNPLDCCRDWVGSKPERIKKYKKQVKQRQRMQSYGR
tara:strand:- start:480 stop:812 length:333 start_codon:yes stop_codon:yes gene_type:complete